MAKAQVDSTRNSASDEFSSSTQALVASDSSNSLVIGEPASAAPALGGTGQRAHGSYGYHDNSWTDKLTFEGGGGFNAPIGNDHPFITYGGNFTGGVGMNIVKHISVLAEYQFIDDKLPGSLIAEAGAQGGHAHIWSLTLDPTIDFFPGKKNSMYVTGGGGFYRKVTSFTDPEEVEECYYFCVTGTENVVVSHFSSNQGGANLGIGFTHQLGSRDTGSNGRTRLFAEARYLWIDTPAIGTTDGLGRTGLIPVTLGLRF